MTSVVGPQRLQLFLANHLAYFNLDGFIRFY